MEAWRPKLGGLEALAWRAGGPGLEGWRPWLVGLEALACRAGGPGLEGWRPWPTMFPRRPQRDYLQLNYVSLSITPNGTAMNIP